MFTLLDFLALNVATIDARASNVTITANAAVGVRSSAQGNYRLLTLTGHFVNHGTILIEGNSAGVLDAAQSFIGTSVSLSGGGKIALTMTPHRAATAAHSRAALTMSIRTSMPATHSTTPTI